MQGYIARKRDRWYAVIYEGVDPETGRERRRWVPAGTDRSDAEALAIRLGVVEAERRNGFRSELTVGGFVTRYWLPAKQLRLEPTSFDGYRRSVRLHIHPHLGGIPLRKLQTEQIEQLYTELLATGNTRTGEALSAKTVLEVHVILRAALGDAVRRGFLRNNPAMAATRPKPDAPPAEPTGYGPLTNSAASSNSPQPIATTQRSGSPPPPGCDAANFSAPSGINSTSINDAWQ